MATSSTLKPWALPIALVLVGAAPPTGEVKGQVAITTTSVASRVSGPDQVIVYLEDAPRVGDVPPGPFEMVQLGKDFDPRVLVVPLGATVNFPNNDPILHNVFSVTPGNAFDLGLHKSGETMSARLNQPGVVSVYCNIHPQMVGYILVVSNPFFTHVGADGSFSLEKVPPGTYHLAAWFPFGQVAHQEVEVSAGKVTRADFRLRERSDVGNHRRKDGSTYVEYGSTGP